MNGLSAIADRLQLQLGKGRRPSWKAFLDEVRSCSEEVEHEVRLLRENRGQLQAIIGLIPVAFFVKDHDSRFFLMNRACEKQWGMSFHDLRDTDGSQFFPPDQMAQFLAKDRSIFENGQPIEFEEIFWSAEHKCNRIGYTFKRPMYDDAGKPQFLVCVTLDITDRKMAENNLQFANILLTSLNEKSPDAILVVDADRKIISFNRQFVEMWRLPHGLIEGKNDPIVTAAVASALTNPTSFVARVEYLYEHPDDSGQDDIETKNGRFIDRHTDVLRGADGGYLGRVWFYRDVTDRKIAEAKIARMARFDLLTGLINRGTFVETLRKAIAGARLSGRSIAVLFLDIDNFKDVNDTLGHPVGDQLLQSVACRLLSSIRESDTVARFGGDEFAIMLTDIEFVGNGQGPHPDSEGGDYPVAYSAAAAASASSVAQKIVDIIAEPFFLGGDEVRVSTSIGIALYSTGSPDAETIMSHADVALYRTKAQGRGSFNFFSDAMDREIRARVTLSNELREGIALNQFFLVYQPQIDIVSTKIVGLEALVRWNHPTKGILSPVSFIEAAEKNGLIVPLGQWVLREACWQTKRWLDRGIGPPLIAVNVSGVQFKRPSDLERGIASIVSDTGVPAHSLELELTEGVLMEASQEHNDLLLRFRKAGYRIAIDDFGSGYSSLDYLRRYPVDRIKIAQIFTADIGKMNGNNAIVKAALSLARELDIEVVIEGVESRAQVELLRAWGARIVQGFYYSKPLGASEVTRLLQVGSIVAI